jgi:hypothetical protein
MPRAALGRLSPFIAVPRTAGIGATPPLARVSRQDRNPPVRPDYAEPAAWPVRRCLPSIRPCGIIRRSALWPLCRYRHKTHWSGARHRLNRDLSGGFGSSSYAREELIAEMTGAFVCAALSIVPTVRHADYLGSWLE